MVLYSPFCSAYECQYQDFAATDRTNASEYRVFVRAKSHRLTERTHPNTKKKVTWSSCMRSSTESNRTQ
eukprot:1152557-Rhodomonas_salina.1